MFCRCFPTNWYPFESHFYHSRMFQMIWIHPRLQPLNFVKKHVTETLPKRRFSTTRFASLASFAACQLIWHHEVWTHCCDSCSCQLFYHGSRALWQHDCQSLFLGCFWRIFAAMVERVPNDLTSLKSIRKPVPPSLNILFAILKAKFFLRFKFDGFHPQ